MKVKIINYGVETLPKRAHYNDAGADIYATEEVTIKPGMTYKMPLKFGLCLPDGLAAYTYSRSSLAAKGIVCQLPPIDSGYRGEIHCVISNIGTTDFKINIGDRIGQLVVIPFIPVDLVEDLGTEREAGGFGSTGTN